MKERLTHIRQAHILPDGKRIEKALYRLFALPADFAESYPSRTATCTYMLALAVCAA